MLDDFADALPDAGFGDSPCSEIPVPESCDQPAAAPAPTTIVEPVTDPKERAELVASCEPQILALAGKFAARLYPDHDRRRRDAFDEFVQAGRLGAMVALKRYDKARCSPLTGRPVKYFTVAWVWVMQRMQEKAASISRPSRHLGQILDVNHAFRPGGERLEIAAKPDPSLDWWTDEDWDAATRNLSVQRKEVVRLRFREGLSPQAVAQRMGVSRTRVQVVLNEAIKVMRENKTLRALAGVD